MSRVKTFRCDRCGATLDGVVDARTAIRLRTPQADFTADLCAACSTQIKSEVAFWWMKAKRGRKAAAR